MCRALCTAYCWPHYRDVNIVNTFTAVTIVTTVTTNIVKYNYYSWTLVKVTFSDQLTDKPTDQPTDHDQQTTRLLELLWQVKIQNLIFLDHKVCTLEPSLRCQILLTALSCVYVTKSRFICFYFPWKYLALTPPPPPPPRACSRCPAPSGRWCHGYHSLVLNNQCCIETFFLIV